MMRRTTRGEPTVKQQTQNIIPIVGARPQPKQPRSRLETVLLTRDMMKSWQKPPFQRPIKITKKVIELGQIIKKEGGTIVGTLLLGELAGAIGVYYLVDGQHRREAAYLSELSEFIAEIRIKTFDSFADMAVEFKAGNTPLSRMTPDDFLRAMEYEVVTLAKIRKACPFMGYSNIRDPSRKNSPVISTSVAIKTWAMACVDTPSQGGIAPAPDLVTTMTDKTADEMCRFFNVVYDAWGNDIQNYRLWGPLNLAIVGWLWNKLVVDQVRESSQRAVVLDAKQFKRCCMSLSAERDYLDWLANRVLSKHHRGPAFKRIKVIFAQRLRDDGFEKARLPQPEWASW